MSEDKEKSSRAELAARYHGPDLDARHTEVCRVLPNRRALLLALPKGGVFAEIGVAFGDFSEEIIKWSNPERLYLVDAWEVQRYNSGLDTVSKKFEKQIAAGSVIIKRGLSTDVIPTLIDSYFDFMYIDTVHDYDITLQELIACAPKVKNGGVLAGHDFCSGNVVAPVVYGVIQACNRFCREHGWRYRYITLETGTSFSFCLERM